MKTICIIIVTVTLLAAALSSCADRGNSAAAPGPEAPPRKAKLSEPVDLTALSGTMVFAEVYNMMLYPDDYLGRTIKMSGPYYASYYDDVNHHYVIIEDATACCQQGLEFILKEAPPEAYPPDGSRIEVVGIISQYEEFGNTYYHILADTLAVL